MEFLIIESENEFRFCAKLEEATRLGYELVSFSTAACSEHYFYYTALVAKGITE